MSQLTAVRTASRTALSTQWWHLSLSTGGFDVADGIIEELVTPLVAQAQALGAKRWYFTRCEDASTGVVSQVLCSVMLPKATSMRLLAMPWQGAARHALLCKTDRGTVNLFEARSKYRFVAA